MPKNSSSNDPITPTFIPGQPEHGNFYYWRRMHPSSDASAGRPCEQQDVNNPYDVIFGSSNPSYEQNDLSMNQRDGLSSSIDLAFLLETIDAVIEVLSHSSDELGVVEPQQQ